MIIVRLWGGLGNQLFQYSFGVLKLKLIKKYSMMLLRLEHQIN